MRTQRPSAASYLARPLAQLRRDRPIDGQRALLRAAFDHGITHLDLATNYGPPYGAAEKNFGRIFVEDLRPYRDQLVISSKAGWDMWPGPYGDLGSRKYLTASIDQGRPPLASADRTIRHRRQPIDRSM